MKRTGRSDMNDQQFVSNLLKSAYDEELFLLEKSEEFQSMLPNIIDSLKKLNVIKSED